MLSFYLIFGAGFLGVLGHWLTRWAQGRTQNTFWRYLTMYKANTISSIFANIFSCGVIYSSTPDDIAGRALVLVVLGAYGAGYTLDSKLNKDESSTDVFVREKLKELKRNNAATTLEFDHDNEIDDALRRDANL